MTTATIVGKGPSILRLTRRDFAPGPVITLNHAIVVVRELHLCNPVYSMQKDGCLQHRPNLPPPRRCVCPSSRMPIPVLPETVVLSAAESSLCHRTYPWRDVVDVEAEFGLPWNVMSVVVAVCYARRLGCDSLVVLGCDSYTSGDTARVELGRIRPTQGDGYRRGAAKAERIARASGMEIVFR